MNAMMKQPDIMAAWTKQGAVPMEMSAGAVRYVAAQGYREVGPSSEGIRSDGAVARRGYSSHSTVPACHWARIFLVVLR